MILAVLLECNGRVGGAEAQRQKDEYRKNEAIHRLLDTWFSPYVVESRSAVKSLYDDE